tara:strand:- start:4223 stop:6235 length:2013 start_codon:yes stop_codon:yes gene_type:complete
MIKASRDKKLISIIILLVVFVNSGSIFSLFSPTEILDQKIDEFPYIDHGCQSSKYEVQKKVNNLNNLFDSKITYSFYEIPTASWFCQDRPVVSNGNSLIIENKSEINVSIGVGVFKPIDNFEKLGYFLLIYIFILLINSKFKIIKIEKARNFYVKIPSLLYLTIFFGVLSFVMYNSFKSSLINFLIPLVFGNLLFLIVSRFFNIKDNIKGLITMGIFPLFFFVTNANFFWLTVLLAIEVKNKWKIKLSKFYYMFVVFLLINFFGNFEKYNFSKTENLFEWILFTDKRHKGGLANYQNGYQSLLIVIDLLILSFVFYVFIKVFLHKGGLLADLYNSIILGFGLWLSFFMFSQISTTYNFLVIKALGLHGEIDSLFTPHPDGLNWRGITPSHELTGFWIFLIISLSCYQYLQNREKIYLLPITASLIALALNSQRTALIFYVVMLIYLILKFNNNRKIELFSILFLTVIIFTTVPYGIDRLVDRLDSISYETTNIDYYKVKVEEAEDRYKQYNIEFLEKPNYSFSNLESLEDFYSLEFNTNNSALINSFTFTAKTFGRELQWIKFLYFNDLDSAEYIIGKGIGQSYEVLDLLIEKPHSLYLSSFYQFGFLGILYIVFFGLFLLTKLVFSRFEFISFLMPFFLINGIKNEFIFTHNQIVIFIIFLMMTTSKKP